MKSTSELQKEIQKTRKHLYKLESRLQEVHYRRAREMTDKKRLEQIQTEFRKKYPNETLHPDLLSLVGILPRASRANDKGILRQALAEKYG